MTRMDGYNPTSVVNKPSHGQPYTALDGKVGSFTDDRKHFVTSPTSNVMYTPLCGVRDVYLRSDYRFGEEDPLHYPQAFIPSRCHHAVIRRRPLDSRHPASKWWAPPPEGAFVSDLNSIIDGMGTWDQKVLEPLKADAKAIQERVQLYLEAQERVGTRPNGMVTAASIQLCETLSYLGSLALPYSRARELWSFCQRWYLELHAALDWIQLCKPAMENQSDYDRAALASVTKKAMGAFLFTVKDCEHFFRAGIPFWYVRQASLHPTTRIDLQVRSLSPKDLGIELEALPGQAKHVVYHGDGREVEKACAIEKYGQKIVDLPDAFQIVADTETPKKSSVLQKAAQPAPTRTTSTRKDRKNRQAPYNKTNKTLHTKMPTEAERDKFAEVTGAYTPEVADVWVEAVSSIDRSRRPTPPFNGGYALPDPGLFLWQAYKGDDPDKGKLIRYLKNWLDLREVLIFRNMMDPPCPASIAWSSRQWRLILGTLDADHEAETGSSMAKHRELIQAHLGQCFRYHGLTLREARQNPYHITWRGRSYGVGRLRDVDLVREVVLELFELNFRLELHALNRKMLSTTSEGRVGVGESMQTLDPNVQACFPGLGPHDCPLSMSWDKAAAGLGAERLRHRGRYFLHLRDVVKCWPGAEAIQVLPRHTDLKSYSDAELGEIEQTVAKFYCQTFYCTFGRPPIIPHRWNSLQLLLPGN